MTSPNPRILGFEPATVVTVADHILRGGIAAMPTETVYGLAADATNLDAVLAVYAAKGRPATNPLIVHVPDFDAASTIGDFDDDAQSLAKLFWPGPLTLVVPLREHSGLAEPVTAGLHTVAIRVPAHRAMIAVLEAVKRPLAAPSANASGRLSPTSADHVAQSLGQRVPVILDDGATDAGLESTIIHRRTILRPGPVTQDMMEAAFTCAHINRSEGGSGECKPVAAAPNLPHVAAPGQEMSHYAPTKLIRLDTVDRTPGIWLIGFGTVEGDTNLSPTGNLTEAASNLFEHLHQADASNRNAIAVAPIPHHGIGVAINDRLRRAAYR